MRSFLALVLIACGSNPSSSDIDARRGSAADAAPGTPDAAPGTPDAVPGTPDAKPTPTADAAPSGNLPAGWLYTSGNQILVADGSGGGSTWVGRGVNADDIFLCGFNSNLGSGGETKALDQMTYLVTDWHPTFVRLSLSMNSNYQTETWIGTSGYKTSTTDIIEQLTAAGVYVLVTLRSDTTMDEPGDEATFVPTDATDPVYEAIVDSFANDPHVLFGLSNEPGGDLDTNTQLRNAMTHAAATIRAEEDRLGVPHHLVSVQGNGWTSDISFYASSPVADDAVIYEVHGYPPDPDSYTYDNIPVILGEYGMEYDDSFSSADASGAATLQADFDAKNLPNAAWDFEAWSDCSPDLLDTSQAPTLAPSAWGDAVRTYLRAH